MPGKLPPELARLLQDASEEVATRVLNWISGKGVTAIPKTTPEQLAHGVRQAMGSLEYQVPRKTVEPALSRVVENPLGGAAAIPTRGPGSMFDEVFAQNRAPITDPSRLLAAAPETPEVVQGAQTGLDTLTGKLIRAFGNATKRTGTEANEKPGLAPLSVDDLRQEAALQLLHKATRFPHKSLEQLAGSSFEPAARNIAAQLQTPVVPNRIITARRTLANVGKYRGVEPGDPREKAAEEFLARAESPPEAVAPKEFKPRHDKSVAMSPDEALEQRAQVEKQRTLLDHMWQALKGDELTPRQKMILDLKFGLTKESNMSDTEIAKLANVSRVTFYKDLNKAMATLGSKLRPEATQMGYEFQGAQPARNPLAELGSKLSEVAGKRAEPLGPAFNPAVDAAQVPLIRRMQQLRDMIYRLQQSTDPELVKRFRRQSGLTWTPGEEVGPPRQDALFKVNTDFAPAQPITAGPFRYDRPIFPSRSMGGGLEVRPGKKTTPEELAKMREQLINRTEQFPYERERVPYTPKAKPAEKPKPSAAPAPEEEMVERVFLIDPKTGERMEVTRHRNPDPATKRTKKYVWFKVVRSPDGKVEEVPLER